MNKRNSVYLLACVTIFVFVAPFLGLVGGNNASSVDDFNASEFLGFNTNRLSSSALDLSGYYNLTGSTIVIDDADPNYNWSKTAAENPWCSGSGTLNDPYVIENVYIDGDMNLTWTAGKDYSANCLSIYRSTAYFIVRGCYFTKAGTGEHNSGISLIYTENGIIYNNTLTYSFQSIKVDRYCSNITIFYNVIENDQTLYGPNIGIFCFRANNSLVTKNLVVNCYVGIHIAYSVDIEIQQNLLNSSLFGVPSDAGIHLFKSNDSNIEYNVLAGDYTGTTFDIAQLSSTGNVIQNNTLSGAIPDNLGTPLPRTSGDYTDLISLAESFSNTIAHNIAFIPGYVSPALGIPSYNMFAVIGAIGLVSTFLIITIKKRKR